MRKISLGTLQGQPNGGPLAEASPHKQRLNDLHFNWNERL